MTEERENYTKIKQNFKKEETDRKNMYSQNGQQNTFVP